MFELSEFEAQRWLRWAVDRAQGWALSDGELMGRLGIGLAGAEREETLREIERRAAIWDAERVAELSSVLSELERSNRRPGRSAQSVDRLLHRLLHRIECARALAGACLLSDRRLRRQAAWRYFERHGVDAAAAAVLSEQLRDKPVPGLVRLAVRSPGVLQQVPVIPLLEQVDEFYWRGRVIETLLTMGSDDDVRRVAPRWPGEFIFGIRRAGRRDLLPLVTRLLEDRPNDAEVISGAIQTFGIFGQTDDMLRAAAMGRRVLDQAEARFAERFGVDRAVAAGSPI